MKKTNLITLSFLAVLIVAVLCITMSVKSKKPDTDPSQTTTTTQTSQKETTTKKETTTEPEKVSEKTEQNIKPAKMTNALFIGDSRTVGIMEYSGINDADFFCDTGMSVFNAEEKRISVPTVGKVTLNELLSNKKYDKIYIMLGINELGYQFDSIINKYGDLIEYIKGKQPNAKIFIQANLHVSEERSKSDDYINNKGINKLNSKLSKFADNKTVFYLDANILFDDSNGNLSASKTQDNAHLYAKYYAEWGNWICQKTAELVKEG